VAEHRDAQRVAAAEHAPALHRSGFTLPCRAGAGAIRSRVPRPGELDLPDLGGDGERQHPADPGHAQQQRDVGDERSCGVVSRLMICPRPKVSRLCDAWVSWPLAPPRGHDPERRAAGSAGNRNLRRATLERTPQRSVAWEAGSPRARGDVGLPAHAFEAWPLRLSRLRRLRELVVPLVPRPWCRRARSRPPRPVARPPVPRSVRAPPWHTRCGRARPPARAGSARPAGAARRAS
jgi:hypothetical protein